MPSYSAPLRDMQFVYNELFDPSEITALPGCQDATADLIEPVLEEAALLAEQELFPLNHSGDLEGCQYVDGTVTTPKALTRPTVNMPKGAGSDCLAIPRTAARACPVR